MMDGSGQSLERRYQLNIWVETEYWVQDRYSTLLEMDRKVDANCVFSEFRAKRSTLSMQTN
jgi:hypothetical protein